MHINIFNAANSKPEQMHLFCRCVSINMTHEAGKLIAKKSPASSLGANNSTIQDPHQVNKLKARPARCNLTEKYSCLLGVGFDAVISLAIV